MQWFDYSVPFQGIETTLLKHFTDKMSLCSQDCDWYWQIPCIGVTLRAECIAVIVVKLITGTHNILLNRGHQKCKCCRVYHLSLGSMKITANPILYFQLKKFEKLIIISWFFDKSSNPAFCETFPSLFCDLLLWTSFWSFRFSKLYSSFKHFWAMPSMQWNIPQMIHSYYFLYANSFWTAMIQYV